MTHARPMYGKEKQRKCLKCLKFFKSQCEGNRICPPCAVRNRDERGPVSRGEHRRRGEVFCREA